MIRLIFVTILFLIYGNFSFVINDIVVLSLINIAFYTVLKEKNINDYASIDIIHKNESNYLRCDISNIRQIKRVLQNPYKNKKKSSIVIITHRSKDSDIQKTLKTLAKKSYIIQKPKLLRIENG